jgi:hypothetical protein
MTGIVRMNHYSVSDFEALGDILRAAHDIGLPEDCRHLIVARYVFSAMTESEIAEEFGWSPRYLKTISRSLDSDRQFGRALRRKLSAYKTNSKKVVVRNSKRSYDRAMNERRRTS